MKNTNFDAVFHTATLEEAFQEARLPVPETFDFSNQKREFAAPGKAKKTLWYKADERGAVFGDVANSTSFRWVQSRSDGAAPAESPYKTAEEYAAHLAELEERKRKAAEDEQERARQYSEVAAAARVEFEALPPAPPEHPYLLSKKVPPGPCRMNVYGKLVVPCFGPDGEIQTLQYIHPDGSKRYKTGGKSSHIHLELPGTVDVVLLCEGYATGASLHLATGFTVVCAFDCGKLTTAAQWARGQWPAARLVYCADNDNNGKDGNPGIDGARKAAREVPGAICAPQVPQGKKRDFNDLHRIEGLDAVREVVEYALKRGVELAPQVASQVPPKPATANTDGGKKTASTRLVEYALEARVELWANTDAEPFISLTAGIEGGYRENWHLESRQVRDWLGMLFFSREQKAPSADVIREAVGTLRGLAKYTTGATYETVLRVFEDESGLWINLANEHWQCVHVTGEGWSVKPGHLAPCRFLRTKTTAPLPCPQHGGNLDALREVINVKEDSDLYLLQIWLAFAIRCRPPYPILALTGEAGSAKTTAGKYLKRLVDPGGEKGAPPIDEERLVVAAMSSHVLMMDNVSSISDWFSNALCRVVTGGAFTKRKLYTEFESNTVEFARPILLTSITDVAAREDLQDRTMTVTLRRISDEERRTEEDVDAAFKALHPGLFGALLDVVVTGFKTELPPPARLPRMADFAHWAMRCEPALGKKVGTFERLFASQHKAIAEATILADDVANELVQWLEESFEAARTQTIQVRISELYDKLTDRVTAPLEEDGDSKYRAKKRPPPKYWPSNAQKFSGRVRKLAPALRKIGIHWDEVKRKNGMYFHFSKTETETPLPAPAPHFTTAAILPHTEEPGLDIFDV